MIAPGLTWYYAVLWPAFMTLIPERQIHQLGGVFAFVRTLGLVPMPFIFVGLANSLDSAQAGRQIGMLLMAAFDLAALPLLGCIDFGKGEREAGKSAGGGAGTGCTKLAEGAAPAPASTPSMRDSAAGGPLRYIEMQAAV
jgi:hypothetical protein